MPVEGYDHVAITVADVQSTIDFYERVLGAELCFADRWRSGEMPVAIIQLGGCRMSIHPAAAPAKPHALAPTPGSADLCFRWRGPIADAVAALEAQRRRHRRRPGRSTGEQRRARHSPSTSATPTRT